LLEHPTCVARLAAGTQLGTGLPLVGAYPAERDVIAADLASGADAQEVLDLRLSGNLVHEICHGPPRASTGTPPPWLIVEAAALHLGATAFPRHVFPEMPGEAIPGVAPFVLVGESLARLFGRAVLWRVASGASLADMFGDPAGRLLTAAGWQEWLRRPEPPFARDASEGVAWPLSPDLERAASLDPLRAARELPDLLRTAGAVPWAELPWWQEEPTEADAAMARSALAAMFHVDVLAGSFQTHPHRPSRFRLEVEACLLTRERDPRGVGPGEPPCWIVPPPLCRRLRERTVGPLILEGSDHTELLSCLLEEGTPWMSSRH
jgi:hypothetical protein